MGNDYTSLYEKLRQSIVERLYRTNSFDKERFEELKLIIPATEERINALLIQKNKGKLTTPPPQP